VNTQWSPGISPQAGKSWRREILIHSARLDREYFERRSGPRDPLERWIDTALGIAGRG
jgi:hypothetical protein